MNRIEITKTGINFLYHDDVILKETGNWLYRTTQVKNVWPCLRELCTIASDVTWEDLLNVIATNESLKYFVETCYPNYLFVAPLNIISRNVIVKNHNIKIEPILYPSSATDRPLILDSKIKVKNNDRTPLPASMKWTLLEILDILFSSAKSTYSCFLSYDGLRDERYSLIPHSDTMTCLMSHCAISSQTTLGDIFRFVNNNKMLKAFMSEYSLCNIAQFHKAAKTKPNKFSTDVRYLQIGSYGEFFSKKFYIGSKFYGVARKPTGTEISVTTTPLNELVHLPVLTDNKFTIRFARNSKTFASCFKDFTILDILHAIYWDIGLLSPERCSR